MRFVTGTFQSESSIFWISKVKSPSTESSNLTICPWGFYVARRPSSKPVKVEYLNSLETLVVRLEGMVGRYRNGISGAVRKELSDALKGPLEILIRSGRRQNGDRLDVIVGRPRSRQ
jgi:hypothetical protein